MIPPGENCDSEIIRVEIRDLNENQEVNILDILIIVNLVWELLLIQLLYLLFLNMIEFLKIRSNYEESIIYIGVWLDVCTNDWINKYNKR